MQIFYDSALGASKHLATFPLEGELLIDKSANNEKFATLW